MNVALAVRPSWSARRAWVLAGTLLVLGSALRAWRPAAPARHGAERGGPGVARAAVLGWHYLVALAYSEDSAIKRRWVRATGRMAGGVVAVGLLTLAGI